MNHNLQEQYARATLKSAVIDDVIAEVKECLEKDSLDDQAFIKLFRKLYFTMETSESYIAHAFNVSQETIGSWTRGECTPLHDVQQKVLHRGLEHLERSKMRADKIVRVVDRSMQSKRHP